MAFNTNYHDTGLFGVYAVTDRERSEPLSWAVMNEVRGAAACGRLQRWLARTACASCCHKLTLLDARTPCLTHTHTHARTCPHTHTHTLRSPGCATR
jgi:hypothetical protein